jgi:hypothetical protein
MKTISIAISVLVLVLTFGCRKSTTSATAPSSDNQAASVSQTNLTPEQLGELGAKIKKSPGDAQKILSDQGLTEKSFELQIRQVAQDPEASKRYTAAYKKASA